MIQQPTDSKGRRLKTADAVTVHPAAAVAVAVAVAVAAA